MEWQEESAPIGILEQGQLVFPVADQKADRSRNQEIDYLPVAGIECDSGSLLAARVGCQLELKRRVIRELGKTFEICLIYGMARRVPTRRKVFVLLFAKVFETLVGFHALPFFLTLRKASEFHSESVEPSAVR